MKTYTLPERFWDIHTISNSMAWNVPDIKIPDPMDPLADEFFDYEVKTLRESAEGWIQYVTERYHLEKAAAAQNVAARQKREADLVEWLKINKTEICI